MEDLIMEKILSTLGNFHAAIVPNKQFCSSCADISTIENIEKSGFTVIKASVPGNTELDMMAAGMIDFDPFYDTNIFKMQDYENLHTIYFTKFDKPECAAKLCFDGIDTIADIYVNGILVKSTDNMYLTYEVALPPLAEKDNELVVHIKPVMIEARKYDPPLVCNAMDYGYASIYVRKAAHMFGWDIMPRIVSSGLWKPVYLKEIKQDLIREAYIYTLKVDRDAQYAQLSCYIANDLAEDKTQDYKVRVRGVCGDSVFEGERALFANCTRFTIDVKGCKLWWPRYAGEQNLYSTEIELVYNGKVVDTKHLDVGIRTTELVRTDVTDKDGNGDFCFKINGERIFAMGSNWVPLDPFHSRDTQRLQQSFDLLYDVGSNVVRCWGGNVYESDEFYSLCDKYGIMVWQDFAMGCAVYPQEQKFYDMLHTEAVQIIKRLRVHPSIVLWAGDNEGDYAYMSWGGMKRNPDKNIVTRRVLAEICEAHDFTRPYLPSSPYITAETMRTGADTSEDHLWGPRDYFKGNYYKNTVCHFASETGYHACPSPESVKKFIPEDKMWPWYKENGKPHDCWYAHAASMECDDNAPFAYRIKLMADQVITLFGKEPDNFVDFAKQSQISQGEAVKYYIERFRLSKPRRSGIIWWNIVDGWPQFSDAVVDYYFTKKVGYHYIKRAQQPVCLMFDEPVNNTLSLYVANDTLENATFTYKVTNITDGKVVLSGGATAFANASTRINELKIDEGEKKFYLIEWSFDGDNTVYKNHYFTNIINIDYDAYMDALKKCGFDQFEGF